MLWCVVCLKERTICGLKKFSRVWINCSNNNHETSNITDHANSEKHKLAMFYFCQDQAKGRNEPITRYSLIACSLLSSMDSAVKKKFNISFFLAKEHMPFMKYPAIHELEEGHGVDLRATCKN